MDPITILHLAGTVASLANAAYGVGISIYTFVQDTKQVDQSVRGLSSEVKALGGACDLIGKRLYDIIHEYDQDKSLEQSALWECVSAQVDDCKETIEHLQDAIASVQQNKHNFISQAWRQITLNMKAKNIGEVRNRIRSHTAGLQLVLQAIAIEISYIGPSRADQHLLTLLESVRDIKQELYDLRKERDGTQQEERLLQYTDKMLSSGATLYEGSIAGGSVIDVSQVEAGRTKVTDWMDRLQALRMDDPPLSEGTPFSSSKHDTLDRSMAPFEEDVADDTIEVEVTRQAIQLGRDAFEAQDFAKADLLLKEVLKMIEESPIKSNGVYEVAELKWMLATCSYKLAKLGAAEVLLKEIVQSQAFTDDEHLRICDAGNLLAQIQIRNERFHEARQYCNSALKARRKLLNKSHESHESHYESLALMSIIYSLEGNETRAQIYSHMIPESQREALMIRNSALMSLRPSATAAVPLEPPTVREPLKESTVHVSKLSPQQTDEVANGPAATKLPLKSSTIQKASPSASPNTLSLGKIPDDNCALDFTAMSPQTNTTSPPLSSTRRPALSNPPPSNKAPIPTQSYPINTIPFEDRKKWIIALGLDQDVDYRWPSLCTPRSSGRITRVHLAALFGDVQMVKEHLRDHPHSVNAPIRLPASSGEGAQYQGLSPLVFSFTPLEFAVAGQHVAAVECLVKHGAYITQDPTELARLLFGPFWTALKGDLIPWKERLEILKLLLDHGLDLRWSNWFTEKSLLHHVVELDCGSGDEITVRTFLEGRHTIIKLLLENGADPSQIPKGWYSLDACWHLASKPWPALQEPLHTEWTEAREKLTKLLREYMPMELLTVDDVMDATEPLTVDDVMDATEPKAKAPRLKRLFAKRIS